MAEEAFVPGYLLYLLAASSQAASGQFHSFVKSQGLRVPEWRILACLRDADGQMITELSRNALFEQSHLTKTVNQMEARRLVTRKTDSHDLRRVRIWLTSRGRKLADQLVTEAREHEAKLLGSMSTSDAQRIKPALRSLLDLLSEADVDIDIA